MYFESEKLSASLVVRLERALPQLLKMTLIMSAIAVLMSILYANCVHAELVYGLLVGVLAVIPLFFLFWAPFLTLLFLLKLLPPINCSLLTVSRIFLLHTPFLPVVMPVPFSPPRFRLA